MDTVSLFRSQQSVWEKNIRTSFRRPYHQSHLAHNIHLNITLLKTPKSEKELLLLCDKILKEEIAEEKTESEPKGESHRSRDKGSDSKKQAVLGERVFHVVRVPFSIATHLYCLPRIALRSDIELPMW